MGKRVSFASMADDPVVDAPGIEPANTTGPAQLLPLADCLANPRNPRDDLGDLTDLESIKDRQLSSCAAVTLEAYLALWPEDRPAFDRFDPSPNSVVVIAGNRRLAAATKYGRPDLLVVVDDTIAESRATLLRTAYDENEGRKDFDPIEEAKSVMSIVEQYPSARAAAAEQGWTSGWISQRKSLLRLHPEVQERIRLHARTDGKEGISIRDARRLAAVEGVEEMTANEQFAELVRLAAADALRKAEEKKAREAVRAASRTGLLQDAPPGEAGPSVLTAVNTDGPAAAPADAVPAGTTANAEAGAQGAPPVDGPTTAAVFTAVNTATPAASHGAPPSPSDAAAADGDGSSETGTEEAATGSDARPPVFTAVNTAHAQPVGAHVPDQRNDAPAEPPRPVDWHDVEVFAEAILDTLTDEEASLLADALANRLGQRRQEAV